MIKKVAIWVLIAVTPIVCVIAGRKTAPERIVEKIVEKRIIRPDPEFALDMVRCLQRRTEKLRECTDCPCYPARWAARMSEMDLRNCVGDQDDVVIIEMGKWGRGEYGWTREHVELADREWDSWTRKHLEARQEEKK